MEINRKELGGMNLFSLCSICTLLLICLVAWNSRSRTNERMSEQVSSKHVSPGTISQPHLCSCFVLHSVFAWSRSKRIFPIFCWFLPDFMRNLRRSSGFFAFGAFGTLSVVPLRFTFALSYQRILTPSVHVISWFQPVWSLSYLLHRLRASSFLAHISRVFLQLSFNLF